MATGPEQTRRPVFDGPQVMTDWHEDADEVQPIGVGWSITGACKFSFDAADKDGLHDVHVSLGDTQPPGGPIRTATREQIAAFGRMLVEQFGEPDDRDDIIRVQARSVAKTANELLDMRTERDGLRSRLDQALAENTRLDEDRAEYYDAWKQARFEVDQWKATFGHSGLTNALAVITDRDQLRTRLEKLRSELCELRSLVDRFDPTSDSGRSRAFKSDLLRLIDNLAGA